MQADRRTAIALGACATASLAATGLLAQPTARLDPADLLRIESLLMQYAWGIDTLNAAEAASVFSRDAIVHDLNGKIWRRSNGGAAAFVGDMVARSSPGVQHHVQINRIVPGGGRCLVESYWSQVTWKAGAPRPELLAMGAFVDRLVERRGAWLIAEKRISLWNNQTVRVPVVAEPGA